LLHGIIRNLSTALPHADFIEMPDRRDLQTTTADASNG